MTGAITGIAGAALVAAVSCGTSGAGPTDGGADSGEQEAPAAGDDSTTAACAAAGGQCVTTTGSCLSVALDEGCGPGTVCCVLGPNGICAPDAAPWLIQASNYNTSCSVDSDCVTVGGFGDACLECFNCGRGAVNRSSEAKYQADLAASPAAGTMCNCPPFPNGPCCVGGVCQVSDTLCPPRPVTTPFDAGGNGADATGADAATDATDDAADASAEAAEDVRGSCTQNSDCPAEDWCLFRVGDCSAQGQCLSPASLGALCNIAVAYCGCNGPNVMGLCGQPYAFGPTLGSDAGFACAHTDAGDQ